MATATPTLKFTIGQYDLMIEAGVFARPLQEGESDPEPSHVELIDGEIIMMSPIGSRHEEIVDRLAAWNFKSLPDNGARVRIQQSLGIPGRQSVPQPDVAWVTPGDYVARRPEASDAHLVIEVAETSLDYDLGDKAALYATGGVPEYWVVDVVGECVHLLREPGSEGYAEHRTAGRDETVSPLVMPAATLSVDSIFIRRKGP